MIGKKVGRNDPCPCGSGLKFKKCHGLNTSSKIIKPYDIVSQVSIQPDVHKKLIESIQKDLEHKKLFGKTRPTISLDSNDYKFVAVGNEIHYSKKWKTFHDFLISYIKICLGEGWGNSELQKPFRERHIILQWYKHLCDFQATHQKKVGEISSFQATGPIAAYLSIAYDLYILMHHSLLQERLIERIKDKVQFQGARYELYVTTCFIKAGFDIDYEDETDRTISHCEFIATHIDTGKKYSIEAKSRHRPGILGQAGIPIQQDSVRLRVGSLLRNALQKEASYPRIVFIDINMPPQDGTPFDATWLPILNKEFKKIENEIATPSYLFFTNHPFHYVGEQEPQPKRDFLFTSINIPEFRGKNTEISQINAQNADPTVWILWDSINAFTKIPKDFEE